MVFLWGGAVSYERGTPVCTLTPLPPILRTLAPLPLHPHTLRTTRHPVHYGGPHPAAPPCNESWVAADSSETLGSIIAPAVDRRERLCVCVCV